MSGKNEKKQVQKVSPPFQGTSPRALARKKKREEAKKKNGPAPQQKVVSGRRAQKRGNHADRILKTAGGHGTDIRSIVRTPPSAKREILTVEGQDPSLDVIAYVNYRALANLAMGTLLAAIRRGWLSSLGLGSYTPYAAFRYLIDAYVSAANGTIPALQQAPEYFWELCYALKPKTQRFKTATINYSNHIYDSLDEETIDVEESMGPTDENYHIYWGVPSGGDPAVNGYSILLPPSTPYSAELGEESVKKLWQFFDQQGFNRLIADPGTDAFCAKDTSAQAMNYAEVGISYGSPGGLAVTTYSEREIHCPILSKFCVYQEVAYRGSHTFQKTGGSACYLAPRLMEFERGIELKNKVSPVFLFYNFDEYVQQAALMLCRAQEVKSNQPGGAFIPYPLSAQNFQICLRQALLPYFSNYMAQDIRMSSGETGDVLATFLPFVVGPNGNSLTQKGEGMKLGRFFVEMVRCARRLTGELSSGRGVVDLVPILGRPGAIAELGQFTWVNGGGEELPLFKVSAEQPIDLVECSATVDEEQVYVDLNGPTLATYVQEHNNWMASMSDVFTTLTDLSAAEHGVRAMNLNVMTENQTWIFDETPLAATSSSVTRKCGYPAPNSRRRAAVRRKKDGNTSLGGKKMEKQNSRKKLPSNIGTLPPKIRVGASPTPGESTYLLLNVGQVSVTSLYPQIPELWKYQSLMVKPVFLTYENQESGSTGQYQTVQIQPYTLPLAAMSPLFTVSAGQLAMPSVFTKNLAAANLDVKAVFTNTLSEMEQDFNTMQEQGKGGFFQSIAGAIGGYLDSAFGI